MNTGVKQACILRPLLLGIAIDSIMRKSIDGYDIDSAWLSNSTLEDLGFTNVALLSGSSSNMQVQKIVQYGKKGG